MTFQITRRCRDLFERAVRGEEELFIPSTAIAELTWLLVRQKGVPKHLVADHLLDLFRIEQIIVENEDAIEEALRWFGSGSGLSFVDCYHLTLARELGMRQIYSFDKKMGRYTEIERIEP